MRIWSLHPKLLDQKGLIACWRETLLAQKVLQGNTKGYRHHPQLQRFQSLPDPIKGIGTYLTEIYIESFKRGYTFNSSKILKTDYNLRIPVTKDQLEYEFCHLKAKLQIRDPSRLNNIVICHHPMFTVIDGPVEKWEKIIPPSGTTVSP